MDLIDLVASTEVLSYEDCRGLLASERVGRLGVVVDGRPEIFPVNYGMDGDGIVYRTNEGQKMRGILTGDVVFEVDRISVENQTGWSVVVHGKAEDISHFDSPQLRESAEASWTGPKQMLVRITPAMVTGRRVRPASAD